jgi:iron complex transport system ATP-binding protein
MSTNTNIISTQELSIGYRSKRITNTIASNLNLQLTSGQLYSLVGANGVGKSTLLRTITGIQKPLQGSVFLHERNIHDITTTEIAQELSLVLTEKLPLH